MSAGMVDVLPKEQMWRLGFDEGFPGFWFSSTRVEGDIWLDFSVNSTNGAYDYLVARAMIGKPELYGLLRKTTRDRYVARINQIVSEMNAAVLAFKFDHTSYGVGA
jgi:hypothetical protein